MAPGYLPGVCRLLTGKLMRAGQPFHSLSQKKTTWPAPGLGRRAALGFATEEDPGS